MNALIMDQQTLFMPTPTSTSPSAEQLASIAQMAAEEVQRFGMPPKVAFLSHSMFGSSNRPSAKMRAARDLFAQRARHRVRWRDAGRCGAVRAVRETRLPG
jgi:malate dehydrogenase (oxaloacetate-decarboxylating)(NADP+)